MLAVVLLAALSSPPEGARVRLSDYVDEVCADAPDGTCVALYALVEVLESLVQDGATEAGSWCCKSCKPGGPDGPKVTCQGCAPGGKGFQCGGMIKHADRLIHLDCPGVTTAEGEAVSCF